ALLIGIDAYQPPTRPLDGCVNDANEMRAVLEERFHFTDIRMLLNEQATSVNILKGLSDLLAATQPGDNVVIYYAGHGSRMRDREGDEPSGFDSTWHTVDSGGMGPSGTYVGQNNDITDDEIGLFLQKFGQRTDRLTLIVDACHSGGISRSTDDSVPVRSAPDDTRPISELPPSRVTEPVLPNPERARVGGGQTGATYVLLAGCRDEEESREIDPRRTPGPDKQHGALTWYLTQALRKAESDWTYRDVFEQAAADVSALYAIQHPQYEGRVDRALFGLEDIPAGPYVLVSDRAANSSVTLAAGEVHGVTVGSRYDVYPARAKQFGTSTTPPLGEVEVVTVGAVTATARIIKEATPNTIGSLCRAVETQHVFVGRRWDVSIVAPAELAAPADALRTRMAKSLDCPLAENGAKADFTATLLGPRTSAGATDPFPSVGALGAPTWIISNADGKRLAPPVEAGHEDVVAFNLATLARWHRLRNRQNESPASAMRGKFRVQLQQLSNGAWVTRAPAEGQEHVVIQDRANFRLVVSKTDPSVPAAYLHALYLDSTGAIAHMWPKTTMPPMSEAQFVLGGDPKPWWVEWPSATPMEPHAWSEYGADYTRDTILVFATLNQTNLAGFKQPGVTTSLASTRSFGEEPATPTDDWAVIALPLHIWRLSKAT
ncbi:MAG: caspase family protein, partial [Gemmatimonadetes bacterium]|nr:caspase family protein [Gemmatimonadota bacterium]